jgi:N-terminal acetyltransferase B complex non-catalytic subunit
LVRIPGQDGTVRALWEKAAKTRPQELEIQSKWFSMAFEADDWKTAQKVSLELDLVPISQHWVTDTLPLSVPRPQ